VTACERGLTTVHSRDLGCDLYVDDAGRSTVGEQVCIAVRPEKVRLSKAPPDGTRRNRLKGVVWELGYLGNRSTYQVKTPGGKIVTAFAQNERRTLDWAIDWSDEVYLSWDADAAVLLQS
jgi:putrescine transport system ATP-binding protein